MVGPTLHLASASPRRRDLVRALNIPFSAGVAPVDEKALEASYRGPAEGLAEYLARAKGAATVAALPAPASASPFVLTADTTVVLDCLVLGKPRDEADAVDMLRRLRGKVHTVVTGVALAAVVSEHGAPAVSGPASDPAGDHAARPLQGDHAEPLELAEGAEIRATSVTTPVRMRDYTNAEIAAYVASGDPLDKAGAYGVQHPHFQPVASIEGCYLAVVGLPLCAVAALLAEAGADVPATTQALEREAQAPCRWSPRCQPPLPTFRRGRG
jgi:septum formation protein